MALALPLSLFASGEPTLARDWRMQRWQLDPCCWVDFSPGFLGGGDELLASLQEKFDWRQGRRLMYGQWRNEPRLTAKVALDDQVVPAVVNDAVKALEDHYQRKFEGLFCNYYQTGQDSVAWHADRIGRTTVSPLVAIISLGGPRTLAMREQGRTQAGCRWKMYSGDLLVMGGATQHHWEHTIAKTRYAPPRMSLTTRSGVFLPDGFEPIADSGPGESQRSFNGPNHLTDPAQTR